jgi:hypothetical protein
MKLADLFGPGVSSSAALRSAECAEERHKRCGGYTTALRAHPANPGAYQPFRPRHPYVAKVNARSGKKVWVSDCEHPAGMGSAVTQLIAGMVGLACGAGGKHLKGEPK